MGFQVIGGVNCNSCKKLHTVVTSVSANCAHSSVVHKGKYTIAIELKYLECLY